MTNGPSPLTLTEILAATFHPFTDSDWESFAGVEGDNPMIAEIDNDLVAVMDDTGDELVIQLHQSLVRGKETSWGWRIPQLGEQL